MKTNNIFPPVKEEDILIFDVLEWYHEGYEFGRPALMLSPVVRVDNDHSAESLIESVLLDMVCANYPIQLNNEEDQIKWRGWNLKYLRKVFNQVMKGKKYPKAGYYATRKTVEIIKDKDGLTWKDIILEQHG